MTDEFKLIEAQFIDFFFKGIRFDSFPEIDYLPYVKIKEENYGKELEWDLEMMTANGKNKELLSLFPGMAVPGKIDWEQFNGWFNETENKEKSGGVARFFVEKDDIKFIKGFNKRAGASDIKKFNEKLKHTGVPQEDTGTPQSFFKEMEKYLSSAAYNETVKEFRWDFYGLLVNKPKTIYEAYRRFAHNNYSRRFIGEDAIKSFIKKEMEGYYKIIKKQINKKDKAYKLEEIDENESKIENILKNIQISLESFKDNDPYIPLIFDEFKKRYDIEQAYDKKRKPGKFSREESQNINAYCEEMSGKLESLGLSNELEAFNNEISKGIYSKVNALYALLNDHPSVKKGFKENKIKAIEGYFRQSFREVSLNDKVKTGEEEYAELGDVINAEEAYLGDSGAFFSPDGALLEEEESAKLNILLQIFEEIFDQGFIKIIKEETARIVLRDITNFYIFINARCSNDAEVIKNLKGKHADSMNLYKLYNEYSGAPVKLKANEFTNKMREAAALARKKLSGMQFKTISGIFYSGDM